MKAQLILFSNKDNEIENFLTLFYLNDIICNNTNLWKKEFSNPIEITDFIAAFIDNISKFALKMWISLDKDVFIKISPSNYNNIIKYLFERYPY